MVADVCEDGFQSVPVMQMSFDFPSLLVSTLLRGPFKSKEIVMVDSTHAE
jgi:hypothetical protein